MDILLTKDVMEVNSKELETTVGVKEWSLDGWRGFHIINR